jgi:type IV fimbrial biogenesis protein FimT
LDDQCQLLDPQEGRIMLTRPTIQSGFTLIEIMIGIGVLAVLLMLAMPSFGIFLQNAEIRNAADATMNGLQLARAEAVRRNRAVEFAFTTGANWSVTQLTPLEQIQARDGDEGTKNASVDSGGSSRVTFGPLGSPLANNPADGSLPMTRIDIASNTTLDGLRPLAILISPAGNVRMCDPDAKLPAGDPRRCEQ